jgi:hypothetical protein
MRELTPRGTPRSDAGTIASGTHDPDGIRFVAGDPSGLRQKRIYQALAIMFAGACAAYVLMPRSAPRMTPAPEEYARAAETKHTIGPDTPSRPAVGTGAIIDASDDGPPTPIPGGAVSTRPLTPRRMATQRPDPDAPPADSDDLGAFLRQQFGDKAKDLDTGDVIQALNDAGIHEGIAAFPPPGTSPPLEGLAVPEDFELPDGYVRHYQATDDGQAIEPILMYSPDYEFFDENGQPVQIPEDRVVPADKAPPGLPIRPIEIPPKREPGDLSR